MEIVKITKRRVAAGAPVAKLSTIKRNRKPRTAIKRGFKTPAWRIRAIREFWASLPPRVATDLLVRLKLRQLHGREYINLPPWCAEHPFTRHLKNVKWTDRPMSKWKALAKAGAEHIDYDLKQIESKEEEDW